jgi:uncharacterized RDD family membrane protein YckC
MNENQGNNQTQGHNPFQAPGQIVRDVQNPNAIVYAGRGQRFGGALIDGILAVIVTMPIILAFFGFSWTSYGVWVSGNMLIASLMSMVLGLVIYLLLHGYLLHTSGQTIGKKLLGMKIVRSDGSKPDLVHLIVRRVVPLALVGNIPYIGGVLMLVNALLIFRTNHRCGHDEIADTYVVDVD